MLESRIQHDIAWLTLNHADRGNSFGAEEAEALGKVLKTKKLRGLVMTGCGERFFCTGGNLRQQAQAKTARAALAQQLKIRKTLDELARTSFPTAALINGDCFGGGVELVSAFDYVVAAPHVLFGFWQRRLGLSFGWGGGARLLRRLSAGDLLQKSEQAQCFSAHEAARIGLIDDIAQTTALPERGRRWIERAETLPSFETFKKWQPANDTKTFAKLWMNPLQQSVLKSLRKT